MRVWRSDTGVVFVRVWRGDTGEVFVRMWRGDTGEVFVRVWRSEVPMVCGEKETSLKGGHLISPNPQPTSTEPLVELAS